jgi:hypothetical protein
MPQEEFWSLRRYLGLEERNYTRHLEYQETLSLVIVYDCGSFSEFQRYCISPHLA